MLLKKILNPISRKSIIIVAILILLILASIAFSATKKTNPPSQQKLTIQNTPTPTAKKDGLFGIYTPPKIPKKDVSTIFMVGDSMTEALGSHGGRLNEFINILYQSFPGHQKIVIDNYAKGSTNLLGLADAMHQKTISGDAVFDPLLSRHFDILLIESFGYNPPSQLGVEQGLKTQTQTLDSLMKLLTTTHPQSVIIFVATIAPNKGTYAQEVSPGQTLAERQAQAEERMTYIKNHIEYAKMHNIPLIDIYTKSLTPNGDGNLIYINPNDHIHPSFKGIDFISHEIANFIYEQQILPR